MTDNISHVEPVVLEASLGADNIIYVTASGRFTNQHYELFMSWVNHLQSLIVTQGATETTVPICADVSGVTHFETKIVRALRDMMNDNKKYGLKTAIVGANNMMQMLLDAIVALTGRTNIRQFPVQKEALDWLQSAKSD